MFHLEEGAYLLEFEYGDLSNFDMVIIKKEGGHAHHDHHGHGDHGDEEDHDDHGDDHDEHGQDGHHEDGPETYHLADKVTPVLWSLFFFIATCNLLGLIPFVGSPTGVFGVTLGLAGITFLTTA